MPKSAERILQKVKETIKRYKLLNKQDKVLIGVSGGPDSVTLLYLFNKIQKEYKLSLHIAHLDHMLRDDSCEDREFVKGLALKFNLPVTFAQINVRSLSKKGSLEEISRRARLGFLFNVAKDIKADKIALGHNFDDQAETVLMRVLRGTGLYGLSGILPKREISGFKIIRPLIGIKRKEIERYLRRKKITFRSDTTNLEDVYFRNKIRNKLFPLLEKSYNKNIKNVLSNLAETAGYDYDYLIKEACQKIKGAKLSIKLDRFKRFHPAIQRLALRLLIARIKGDTRRITLTHIRELEDLILNRPENSIVNLPKGIFAVKKKNNLSFYRSKH